MPPRRPQPKTAEIVTEVRAIYAELERRPVERACTRLTECCRFRLTGRTPFLTKAEAVTVARGWRASGRTKITVPDDGSCPLLDQRTGRCLVYDSRPFGCRTHFCAAAGGPYARREVSDLIHRLEDLSRAIGGTDAKPLASAVQEALREG